MALLAPPHIRDSENCTYRRRYREKGNPTKERPWLDTLRSAEDVSEEAEKRATLVLSSIVGGISEPLMHRGAKSAKSPSLSPDEEGPSTVNSMDVKPEEARRTLVTYDPLGGCCEVESRPFGPQINVPLEKYGFIWILMQIHASNHYRLAIRELL